MVMKSLTLVAIALGCSMGTAVAQNSTAAAAPSPQQEKALKALVEQHAATAKAGAPATGSKANPSGSIVLGWNYAHAVSCGWFQTLLGVDQWFYIFTQEGGIIFSINNVYINQVFQVPCVNGNLIGWHVYDLAPGAYDQVQSFDFK